MKRRFFAGALLLCLLLSGCTPMSDRSYTSESPHVQYSNEEEDPSIRRAETYQGLVSALLDLIAQGEDEGIIRLHHYTSVTGTAESDVDKACLTVTQEDPLGAYALDYIKYTVRQDITYYEVSVTLSYIHTLEQIRSIIQVTDSVAVGRELPAILAEHPREIIFRITHFSPKDNVDTMGQAVLDAYEKANANGTLPELQGGVVNLYPEEGEQRLAEIILDWGS